MVADTLTPSFASSPRILRHPHRGFFAGHPQDQDSDLLADGRPAAGRAPPEGPLPPDELAMPSKQRLRTDQERRPASSWERPADRGHEHPVAATKMRLAQLPFENHQLVAQDYDLEVGVQIVGGAGEQPDHPAQQQIREREEHVTNLPGDEGRADPTNALAVGTISGSCAFKQLGRAVLGPG